MDGVYSLERTRALFGRITAVNGKRELAEALAAELGCLNVLDLQRISESLEREVSRLPSPYKEKIHPYFMEQLFGSYFKLMRMHGDGTLASLEGGIKDKKIFEDFCRMASERDEKDGVMLFGGYYYLVSCFLMFVLDEPGHPAGMPFPGG
ncbi:MAG TPA: DUF2115 family protein, partial [Methanocella sp.]|nr:DUF2115 family protein [Methanocella sp.]